jgi:hypothetical protein
MCIFCNDPKKPLQYIMQLTLLKGDPPVAEVGPCDDCHKIIIKKRITWDMTTTLKQMRKMMEGGTRRLKPASESEDGEDMVVAEPTHVK